MKKKTTKKKIVRKTDPETLSQQQLLLAKDEPQRRPTNKQMQIYARRKEILRLYFRGRSMSSVAKEKGMDLKYIYKDLDHARKEIIEQYNEQKKDDIVAENIGQAQERIRLLWKQAEDTKIPTARQQHAIDSMRDEFKQLTVFLQDIKILPRAPKGTNIFAGDHANIDAHDGSQTVVFSWGDPDAAITEKAAEAAVRRSREAVVDVESVEVSNKCLVRSRRKTKINK